MDLLRTGVAEQKKKRRLLWAAAGVVVVVAVSFAVSSLEPAAPSVDSRTIWMGTVERGSMLRQVRGHGTLQPEVVRWIPAATTGRVERIRLQPGAVVNPDDVILELSNPEVEQAAANAESVLKRAEAELESLRMTLKSQELTQRAEAAAVEAEFVRATLRAEADRELSEKGLISSIELRLSATLAESYEVRREIEAERVVMTARATAATLEAERAEVERQRALYELRASQLAGLEVRAGLAGVVQEIPLEVGQQVVPGANLARVAEPRRLKAELRVPATQARELLLDQAVSVDTRNGLVPGKVARIDPVVRDGTVEVEVRLEGELPPGARPDLNVDGTIAIEHLEDILFVGRPAQSAEGSTVGLFRVEADGDHAVRVQVELGRASVDAIEVVGGLAEGDRVVLSDTSRWDDHERIRLR